MNLYNIWTKVLLENYGNLDSFANAIDRKVEVVSHSVNENAMNLAEVLIELIENKKLLCNTKVLVKNVLNNIDMESRKVLVLKYIYNMSFENIAEVSNTALRTVYRKFNTAKDKFAKMLLLMGYNEEKLTKMYKGKLWIYHIYCNLVKKMIESGAEIMLEQRLEFTDDALKTIEKDMFLRAM